MRPGSSPPPVLAKSECLGRKGVDIDGRQIDVQNGEGLIVEVRGDGLGARLRVQLAVGGGRRQREGRRRQNGESIFHHTGLLKR